jgi:membrane-bound lytic murein transglycosylase D
MKLLTALFFATTATVAAQSQVEVPHKMQFADLTLTIRDDARKEIQKDVDAFVRYPKSFLVKAERARTYFPIIEQIFAEENVPDDIKFLAIQESALIPDAVSTSNAVGFWQFKDFTAIEMGLRVDKEVDERLNIVSSTRAAARYFKKNNTFFDNWLFALQAYQMGAGGVMRSEKNSKAGEKHMEITSNTYWYVKKYLAHKIAYEEVVKGPGEISVVAYQTSNRRSLSDVAREVKVSEEELVTYNKWAKSGVIPGDRAYTVVIPVKGPPSNIKLPQNAGNGDVAQTNSKRIQDTPRSEDRIKINGITAIKGLPNETPATLAARSGLELASFLKYNDLSISDKIYPGQFYLLGKKRKRGDEAYHKVAPSDNLWIVSQKYGVQIKKLKRYNHIDGDADLKPGMTLWLSAMKPKDGSKGSAQGTPIEVDKTETFEWSTGTGTVESTQPAVVVSASTETVIVPAIVTPAVADTTVVTDTVEQITQPSLPDNSGSDTVTIATETVIPEATKDEHVVQAGETLYGIAKLYNVGVMDLVNWNSLSLQAGIKPGQVLKLSDPQVIVEPVRPLERTGELVEHEVKPTDTVYSISRKYGVTIKELMEWNNKKDFTLSVGEKLRILKK